MAELHYDNLTLPITAAALFGSHQAIGYDGNVAAENGPMFGLAREDAEAVGRKTTCHCDGVATAIAAGPLAAGDALAVGTEGRLKAAAGNPVVARVMPGSGAAAAGDQVLVRLLPAA